MDGSIRIVQKKYKELLNNTLIFSVGNIGAKAILFFMVPLYTAYMDSEAFGEADLITTTSDLVVPMITLSISNAVFRFVYEKKYDDREILRCFYRIYIPSVLMSAVFAAICFKIPQYSKYAGLLFLIMILTGFNDSYSLYIKARGYTKVFAFNTIFYVLTLCAANVLFLTKFHWSAGGYLIAIVIAKFFSNLFLVVFGRSPKLALPLNIEKGLLRQMLAYSAPLIVNSIFWWIITSSDKYMIAFMIDTSTVGLYNVAAKIPSLVSTFVGVFIEAWTVSVFKEFEKNDISFLDNVFQMFNVGIHIFVSFILFIIREFMSYYVEETYYQAVIFLPLLLMGAFFLAYASYFGVFFNMVKKSTIIAYSSLTAAVINILLNIVLIPQFGGMGAALATLVSYAVIAVYRIVSIRNYMDLRFNYGKWTISVALLMVQCISVTVDFHYAVISMAVFTVLCLLHVNEIKSIVKKGNGQL